MVHFLWILYTGENKIGFNLVSDIWRGWFLDEAEKFETGTLKIVFSFEIAAHILVYQSLPWNSIQTLFAFPLGLWDPSD